MSSFDAYIKNLLAKRQDGARDTAAHTTQTSRLKAIDLQTNALATISSNTGRGEAALRPRAPTGLAADRDDAPMRPAMKESTPAPISDTEIAARVINPDAAHEDIDLVDRDDPQSAAEYVREIYAYLRVSEERYAVQPYFDMQTFVDERARAKLVNWISGVHTSFRLANESFFHAVQILDRFLMRKIIPRSSVELLGISILYLASKYEESYSPSIRHFVDAVKGRFSRRQIAQMEASVLDTLNYNLAFPTPITFLRRYAKIAQMSHRERYLAFFLAEVCLHDARFIGQRPSHVAAASVVAARRLSGKPAGAQWPELVAHYSGYAASDFAAVTEDVLDAARDTTRSCLRQVVQKYNKPRYYEVARFVQRAAQGPL